MPGAQVVHTPAVRSVLRTVAHAAAVGAVVCLYGDAGQGKAVALQYALSRLPHPARVRRVHVGVHPTVPELRRVLADALELGRRLPRGPVAVTGRTTAGEVTALGSDLAQHAGAVAQAVRETLTEWRGRPPVSD
ncbi:hypothetical protein [Streptomyces ardesiacus]|uniref:hypothetical protein n=1 Tax=Streptomyces ardesiacus TaxID=285564 RepID=UPI00364B0F0C